MAAAQTTGAALIIEETGQLFPLGRGLTTIGRKGGNTIVLADDLKVSRHHATIEWDRGTYIIRDFGSANGTFLNDQRLTDPQPLNNGDTIQVGDTTFIVNLPGGDTKLRMRPGLESAKETLPSAPAPAGEATKVRERDPRLLENPYVGPRTFSQEEGDRFFGREREARELLSLVISERLVLFYAQSGAGKSSLINARLAPQLREADFAVLPIGRVSGELPEGIADVGNIYIFNLLLSLDESDGDPQRFTHMPLSDFLLKLTSLDGTHYYYDEKAKLEVDDEAYEPSPYILIIDQFEEIITAHPARWPERENFFHQLAQAMADDPMLWVVLTLREDYVATLDPYTFLLPDKLRARFYMQRMEYEAALEAITRPAEQYGRPFAAGVAESLADNLRQIRISAAQPQNQPRTELGQFVEPVQLQVVCYQLWENLKEQLPGEITQQDLEELGDVDMALAQFYEQALSEVIRQTDVSEIELRNWFEEQLITEAGTKGLVYRGATQTGGIDNQAADLLRDKFLLRSEVKAGGTWYELVHDRFIEPILQANLQWREGQPLIQVARTWVKSGRSDSGLLQTQRLKEVLATNWQGLGPDVQEFLEASQAAQKAKEEAERQRELEQARALAEEQQKRYEEQQKYVEELNKKNIGLRRRTIAITVVGIVAFVMAFAAGVLGWQTGSLYSRAATAAVAARENAWNAATSEKDARNAQETAEAEATAAAVNANLAATSEAEAVANLELAEARQEGAVAAQETAESARVTAVARSNEAQAAATEVQKAREDLENILATQIAIAEATSTPTPSPTATPISVVTPPSRATPTDTPTATPTPSPDLTATAELEEKRSQQATLQAEQTIAAAEFISCKEEPQGELRLYWEEFRDRLGCPEQVTPTEGGFAEQAFENGYMFWSRRLEEFVVTIGKDKGKWIFLNKTDFNPAGAGCEPNFPPSSPDLVQPVRGFGGIWCDERLDIQEEIGYATEQEHEVSGDLLQKFEGGIILRDSFKRVYILFRDNGMYIRFN